MFCQHRTGHRHNLSNTVALGTAAIILATHRGRGGVTFARTQYCASGRRASQSSFPLHFQPNKGWRDRTWLERLKLAEVLELDETTWLLCRSHNTTSTTLSP